MKSRKPAARPGAFRPAAEVAAELLRQVTPRRQRVPRRPVPGVELHDVRVTTVRHMNGYPVATVALTASDAIRVTVAAREFTCRGNRKAEADVVLPITTTADGAVLTVMLDTVPNGLAPGATLSILRIGFGIDKTGEGPTVIAIAEKVIVAADEITAAPVTLWPVTIGPLPPIDGVDDDPIQQERIERWYRCALAAQSRLRAA